MFSRLLVGKLYSMVSFSWVPPVTKKNEVLLELQHIFPNTYQGIRSICSPAKVGIGCYKAVNYQPGS